MKKIFAFLMILGFASSSCEPDDICDPTTPTTPRLLIEFYYSDTPAKKRNVDNLKIIGEGMENPVILNPTAAGDRMYITSGDNVLLPLNTNADHVKYRFILNADKDKTLVNEDKLEFTYTRENFYVSRACGFKTTFNLDENIPFELTDSAPADQIWIKSVIVKQHNITSEDETIIKIFY